MNLTRSQRKRLPVVVVGVILLVALNSWHHRERSAGRENADYSAAQGKGDGRQNAENGKIIGRPHAGQQPTDVEAARVKAQAQVREAAAEAAVVERSRAKRKAEAAQAEAEFADQMQKAEEAKGAEGKAELRAGLKAELHHAYGALLKEYPFQEVRTQRGRQVNIILVRAAMNGPQRRMYEQYKDEILFLGISSFEDFPLESVNPFSGKYPHDEYLGLFRGFLHMMRPADEAKHFPSSVKTILMSQSDFSLPSSRPRNYAVKRKYDFTYSGSDQDVRNDCVGWSSFAKNWSFVKQALEVMCGEYKMTGVLMATKSKDGKKACSIPKSCDGLITQTTFLDQRDFFGYLKQSRFSFLPQIHDASPRVSTQALALDVPMLMNKHISGGWKYMNQKTGVFFSDMTDFRQALERIVKNADIENYYEPRKWVLEHYGNQHSGPRLFKYITDNFLDYVKLPEGTTSLLT